MSVLATALAFARHGHAVFPVNWPVDHNGRPCCSCGSDSRGRPCTSPAKHPYGKLAPNGLLSASVESWAIKLWWHQAPDANLGVCTDKLVVLDIDPRHGGDEAFAVLEQEHGQLPLTWRALTGGGGEHIIFACPDGVDIANVVAVQMDNPPLGPGIDVRARGGYIVAPPSRHISARPYAWSVDHHPQETLLTFAPDWLVARLGTRRSTCTEESSPEAANSPDAWKRLTDKIIREYRDMAAAQVAGHLLRRWVDPHLVAGLLHAWNQTYVDPPLTDHELRQVLNRIARREDQRRDALQGGTNARG
jgi:Bifunctional DNA primase/polymerase, N-terminal/Primase C terminal 1 (PriCT-1)